MTKKLYLIFLLCTLFSKLYSQSFIQSIEHGVYIDDRFILPYTQVVVTLENGLAFETGMLDIPTSINLRFNNTIQTRAGNLRYLINDIEEPAQYIGPVSDIEWYYYLGSSFRIKNYRIIPQIGVTSSSYLSGKVSQYYRVIDTQGAFMDLGIHYQFRGVRNFVFLGYSWGIELDPIR